MIGNRLKLMMNMNSVSAIGRRFKEKINVRMAVIACLILILTSVPVVNANTTSHSKPTPDYGVYSEMNDVLDEMEDNRDSPEIINATEKRLAEELRTTEQFSVDPSVQFETRDVPPQDPESKKPSIYEDMERYESLYGKDSILEFLMDRGVSNYYIYTRYQEHFLFTRDFWRPVLVLPMDLTNGVDIDVDENPATGDGNGNEVFAALRPTVTVMKLPSLFPYNRTIVLRFGLEVELRRLAPIREPLTVHVLKYVSYEEKNYLINVGVELDANPSYLNVEVYTEKVSIELAPGQMILNFINNYLMNNTGLIGNNSILSSLEGPYNLAYELPDDPTELISNLKAAVGLTEVVKGERGKTSWLMVDFKNSLENDHVPTYGHATLDSQSVLSPMDYLMWEARDIDGSYMSCDADIYYYDDSEIITYAEARIRDVPGRFNITVDYTKTVNGTNVTPVKYRAIDSMSHITYRHTQFYNPPALEQFKSLGFTLEHVPRSFDLEITSDINREIDIQLSVNATLPIITQVVDSLIAHIIERFSRIGRVIGGLADGIIELPEREGWMELQVIGDGHFGALEFFRSSDVYLAPAQGEEWDYMTLMNRSGYSADPDDPNFETSPMAGRISGINYLNMNFSQFVKLEANLPGRSEDDEFKIMFLDGDTYIYSGLSNLPRDFKATVIANEMHMEISGGGIAEMTAVYFDGEKYVSSRIEDISRQIHYKEEAGTIEVTSSVPFGKIEFALTNDTSAPFGVMEGNYVYLHQDRERVTLSGQIHSLKHIRYKPGREGTFLMEYENETEFKVYMYNYLDGGSETKVLIDPLPSNLSFDLPGAIGDVEFQLPDIINITGKLDFTSLVSSASAMVDSVVRLSSTLVEAFLENIGGISQELNFAYDLQEDETMDILGYFRKGDTSDLKKVHWCHGISLSQDRGGGNVGMEGKVYFQGMPKQGEISTNISGDDIRVSLSFDQWRPKYHWLLIESYGIQDRDGVIYFNGLKTNMDFYLDVDLTTNMSIGGRIAGEIELDVSSNPGQFYVHLVKYAGTTSSTDILFSSVPTSMKVSLLVENEIHFDYTASSPIKYIYIANSRLMGGEWYHVNGLLHDVVEKVAFSLVPDTRFDPKRPIFIQGLPRVELSSISDESSLDIYFKVDGRTMGQVGNIEIFVQDVESLTAMPLESRAGYKIESTGMSYFSLKARNMPLMEAFTVDELEICGENIESVIIEIDMLFGVYPVFKLSKIKTRSLEINIDGVLRFGNLDYDAKVSIFNISMGDISNGTTMFNNKLALTSKSKKCVIIPGPVFTLWATLLGD